MTDQDTAGPEYVPGARVRCGEAQGTVVSAFVHTFVHKRTGEWLYAIEWDSSVGNTIHSGDLLELGTLPREGGDQ